MPVSHPVRRKRLWPTLEATDVSRELAIRQRLEVQQVVAAVVAAPAVAPAAADSMTEADADAAADAEANAMLPDEDDEDTLALALAEAADAAANALAEADTEEETESQLPSSTASALPSAFALPARSASSEIEIEIETETRHIMTSSGGTLPSGFTMAESPGHSGFTSVASDSDSDAAIAHPPLIIRIPRAVVLAANAATAAAAAAAAAPLSPLSAFLLAYPAPLSIAPLTPELPTGQYATPIVIPDDAEGDADDEEEQELDADANAHAGLVFAHSFTRFEDGAAWLGHRG